MDFVERDTPSRIPQILLLKGNLSTLQIVSMQQIYNRRG